jgi:hypothetical protein
MIVVGDCGYLFWCTNFLWESPAMFLKKISSVLQFVPVHVSLRYL